MTCRPLLCRSFEVRSYRRFIVGKKSASIRISMASIISLAAMQAARADTSPVTISGSTLFNPFFTQAGAAASTNDFIDVDGDGQFRFSDTANTTVEQLAPVVTYLDNGSNVSYQA